MRSKAQALGKYWGHV